MDCDDPPLPALPTFDIFEAELDSERYNMDLGGVYDRSASPLKRPKATKMKHSDTVMHEWRGLCDEYLCALLRLEGVADALERCPSCNQAEATIRCKHCFGGEMYCRECTVKMHAKNPLHVIDEWNGAMFSRTSLQELGLRVRLCHEDCVDPVVVDNFVLLDIGYIHEISVVFCGCERRHGTEQRTEILRKRWYPATHDTPRTAATFNYLNFFIIQTHQAKITMYDFYTATARSTCGSGRTLPNRYPELLRMVRQWRHLQMLKRTGHVNLPEDWENASPEDRFLYFLFLALNACFRLKRQLVSSELCDPGLGTGWVYFVEQEPYRKYLLTTTNETKMSTCSGLAALDYANTKFSRGPTGVGDLQKGERYSNIDWMFSTIMRWKHPRLHKVVSYNIICQWFKKLFERLLKMPAAVRFFIVTAPYQFVIPKMHIHSHTLACQLVFSLNFLLGAGQTDGEGIERPWANLGGVATSMREMGPGSHRDTLDSHLSYWNWSKLITIADLLHRRLDKARIEEREQNEAFTAFSTEQGQRVEGWRAMVHAFEADPKAPNPYECKSKAMTEADVRLSLAEEEAARGQTSLHDVSPTGFIYAGLELEEQQRRTRVSIELKKAQTTAQKIDIVAMRRKLTCGITRFRKLQATYTPAALQEERKTGCMVGVEHTEAIARDGQCGAALLRLRHQLHIKSRFITYKKNNSRHQGANTRSRTLVARNESKIRLHSEKYQTAWAVIRALNRGDASKVGWRKLCQRDIRLMEDSEDLRKRNERRKKEDARRKAKQRQLVAEGELIQEDDDEEGWEDDDDGAGAPGPENRRVLSWIWTVAGNSGSDVELEEALRIEWAKAYARSRRWKEEVRLLEEEYRRILVTFEYEAQRWEARVIAVRVGEVEEGYAQGAVAYGLKQATMYRDIAARAVVTMTELRRGRGKKWTRAVLDEGAASDGGLEEREQGATSNTGREEEAEQADGDDDDGDGEDESDEEDLFGNSDEEFFMGGEDEDD
ncbi:hypothetical protein B0H16DRAFT_1717745 [Mycena metata]|uniref:CxC2-like cysteine cluster KDZ transposase-associated domain-containing protein n=1 Tax=Mycena metata TaxID=1033252 RepID=A0AAD7NL99_9AGAR|nr:hypothetical protein B0H16DRAFT_1717745 [Mycena metata]